MKTKLQLIAPAGKTSAENLDLAQPCMADLGYDLKKDYFSYEPLSYLAASDEQRAESLTQAWLSGEAVISLRGGYGCARLLDLIDWEKLRKTQNILIGHSDLTALHLAFLKHGISRTVSGIMAAAEFTRNPDRELTLNSFEHCLKGEQFSHAWTSSYSNSSKASAHGKIIPLTLSVLCSLIGTKHLPCFDNSILILEDINEAPYKIDRLLKQVEQSQLFNKVSAIIMGDFNNCGDAKELHPIFSDFAKNFNCPLISGLSFGHCLPRLNLPVGAEASLEINQNEITLNVIRY
jgi:muramoyltetrapeptide carboxypeptidase